MLTDVDGDDIRHGRKCRQTSADLGIEAGVLDLLGLRGEQDRMVNKTDTRSPPPHFLYPNKRYDGGQEPTWPDPSSLKTLPNVDELTEFSMPLKRSINRPHALAMKLSP